MYLVSFLKKIFVGLFGMFSLILDYIITKDPTIVICIDQGKQWSGNSKAIFDHIGSTGHGLHGFRYQRSSQPEPEDPRCLAGWWRPRTIWILLRAKTIVMTHGLNSLSPFRFSNRKFFVETWHGVPLKGQQFTEATPKPQELKQTRRNWERYVDVLIAPSRIAAYSMCSSCMLDPRRVFYCGQARNDILFRTVGASQVIRELAPTIPHYEKVILYCPTFRDASEVRLFPFPDLSVIDLAEFLEDRDAVILIRGHTRGPAGSEGYPTNRFVMFDQSVCADVNVVLPEVDVLITDYSSIYFDFLLLDRPIVFVPYDLEQYQRERGFVIDDYDFWTPGKKVHRYREFISAVGDALESPEIEAERRQTISRLMNYYQDGESCEEIVQLIKQRIF